ncbi:cation efflux family protein [Ancylostoma ceylanicum]|uniref:Cation efflux family protein n=1 Tax=Ancylostoma ceylanicum TaxID=53326 RepID=A0A0D6MD85_9BILA|nr:cation efflux family protein [Ancylostoma ceylanicum]
MYAYLTGPGRHRQGSRLPRLRAKHEAALDAAKATTKAAVRLAHATLIVNISLMLAKIIISVVMGVASVQLIYGAVKRIMAAYQFHAHGIGEEPELDVSITTVSIMVATVVVKFTLFMICQKYKTDPSIRVLAMDHRNDCLSNTVALACAWLATTFWYYLDPIGAILVSIYILYTWVNTGWEHLSKLSGKSAKPEFINRIIKVHIVLDENMPLKVAHDISETLQINIESLPEVERAFVHTDYEYEHQPEDEHKVV